MLIRESSVGELFEVAGNLLEANWREVSQFGNSAAWRPDRAAYHDLEARGLLFALIVLDGDLPVGYSVTLLVPNTREAGTLVAMNDVLYVSPPYRTRFDARELLTRIEDAARDRGAKRISQGAPPNSPIDPVLAHRGYVRHEVIYTREL